MLNDLKDGKTVAIFPDGPTGPRHSIHDGVLHLARLTGAPIVPVLFSAKPCWRARSWDRYMLPKPFSQGIVKYGEPFFISRDIGPDEMDQKRDELRKHLYDLETELDNRLSNTDKIKEKG